MSKAMSCPAHRTTNYESFTNIQFVTVVFGKIGTGCGRLWYWTILRWEILLLDFFAVGDCSTGLFCCGRFNCWTFLLWEIPMLDFLASGQMNCTAF